MENWYIIFTEWNLLKILFFTVREQPQIGNVHQFGNIAQIGNMISQPQDNWATSVMASMKMTENVNKIKVEIIYPCAFASSIFIIMG